MIRIEECILYRDFAEGEVLRDMTILVETYKKLVNAQISLKDRRFRENMSAYEPQFYEALNRLVEMANRYGFSGNLWHDYLTYLLVNKENAFSTSCEIVGKVEGSINQMAKHDFVRFKELFDFDICVFDEIFESGDDPQVYHYVMDKPETQEFIKRLLEFLDYAFTEYVKEGKNHFTVAIGCTGGQHRSVSITNFLYDHYKIQYNCYKEHRDKRGLDEQ